MNQEIKQKLRIQYLDKLKNISDVAKKQWDTNIYQQFINSKYFQNYHTIALYFPLPYEVNTITIIKRLLDANKKVALPRINDQGLEFYYINNLNDLIIDNKWNIFQPKITNQIAQIADFDLIIIPLIAFNQKHYRLGHGKGYYDHYLSNPNFKGFKLALAYKIQEIFSDRIFWDNWDIPFDAIIVNS